MELLDQVIKGLVISSIIIVGGLVLYKYLLQCYWLFHCCFATLDSNHPERYDKFKNFALNSSCNGRGRKGGVGGGGGWGVGGGDGGGSGGGGDGGGGGP